MSFNDDSMFLSSVQAGNATFCRRAQYFWYLAWHLVDKRYTLDMNEWESELIGLAGSLVEEGLWLWVDGDEAYLEAHARPDWLGTMPDMAIQRIAHALQDSHSQHDLVAQVRAVSEPAIRCGMICWLVTNSPSITRLDGLRGWTPRVLWQDPVGIFVRCMQAFDIAFWDTLVEVSDSQGLYESFFRTMEAAGHDGCYAEGTQEMKAWLLIRTYLFPEERGKPVRLQDMWDEDNDRVFESEYLCPGCIHSTDPGFLSQATSSPSHIPRVLVFLVVLVQECSEHEDSSEKQLPRLLSILRSQSSLAPFQHATLRLVNTMLEGLPNENPSPIYLPWVNSLPQLWREHVAERPPSFWDELESLLSFDNEMEDQPPQTFDLRAWMTAVWLLVDRALSSSWDLHRAPAVVVRASVDVRRILEADTVFKSILPLVSKDGIQPVSWPLSQHICWSDKRPMDVHLFILAFQALHGTVYGDVPPMGFEPDVPSSCFRCRLECLVKHCLLPLPNNATSSPWLDHLILSVPSKTFASLQKSSIQVQGSYHLWAALSEMTWQDGSEMLQSAMNSVLRAHPALLEQTSALSAPIDYLGIYPILLQPRLAVLSPHRWLGLQARFIHHDFLRPDTAQLNQDLLHLYGPFWLLTQMEHESEEATRLSSTLARWKADYLTIVDQLLTVRSLNEYVMQALRGSTSRIDLDVFHVLLQRDFLSICAALLVVFEDQRLHRRLEMLNTDDMQLFIDMLQEVIDFPDIDPSFRSLCTKRLIFFCSSFGKHPKCLSISGLHRVGSYAVTSGGYGDVWQGLLRGQSVSVKVLKVYKSSVLDELLKNFYREAVIWTQLNHPNVLPFLGIYYLDSLHSRLCLVAPWMVHGNLVDFLQSGQQVNQVSLGFDVAKGIEYLHRNRIIHGDLKGSNILIKPSLRACIADFGFASVVESRGLLASFIAQSSRATGGTTHFLAPELMEGDVQMSYASDIYAYACICYEIFAGHLPFHGYKEGAVILQVSRGKRPPRPASPALDDELWGLIEQCWAQDPASRPNASSVIQQTRVFRQDPTLLADEGWDSSIPSRLRSSFRELQLCPSLEELRSFQAFRYQEHGSDDGMEVDGSTTAPSPL